MARAYHPCKRAVADLFIVSVVTRILCLATDITVDSWEPALLQVFGRTTVDLVPKCRREGDAFFVDSESLEGIVQICRKFHLASVILLVLLGNTHLMIRSYYGKRTAY
jgi:hypothetical protein